MRLLDDEAAALGARYPWMPVDDIRALFERTAMSGELPMFFTSDAFSRHLVRQTEEQS